MQVMLGATIGIARPSAVTWLNSDLFTIFLGFLMLSMGLTLTVEDFKKARRLRQGFGPAQAAPPPHDSNRHKESSHASAPSPHAVNLHDRDRLTSIMFGQHVPKLQYSSLHDCTVITSTSDPSGRCSRSARPTQSPSASATCAST